MNMFLWREREREADRATAESKWDCNEGSEKIELTLGPYLYYLLDLESLACHDGWMDAVVGRKE